MLLCSKYMHMMYVVSRCLISSRISRALAQDGNHSWLHGACIYKIKSFQRATLKRWEGSGDTAFDQYSYIYTCTARTMEWMEWCQWMWFQLICSNAINKISYNTVILTSSTVIGKTTRLQWEGRGGREKERERKRRREGEWLHMHAMWYGLKPAH